MSLISPFQNDVEVATLDDLTIENTQVRIAFYGRIGLTRDKKGLDYARELRDLFNEVVRTLESDKDLPEEVPDPVLEEAPNPFL